MGIAERREREKEQRQKEIIDAAERIFFAEGVENSTMGEVAAAAELSKAPCISILRTKMIYTMPLFCGDSISCLKCLKKP